LGETDLTFQTEADFNVDVLFLCGGHGKSKSFFEKNKVPANVKIIDLSADYRLSDTSDGFVYGLPELNSEKIKKANKIANPGCFATAIELAFLPLAQNNLLTNELHVTAITGSTGAGQAPTETSHFSWKNNNVAVYKAFEHQHLAEINETLYWGGKQKQDMNFVPVRGNFSRGILATCYTDTTLSLDELTKLYQDFYKEADFVHLSNENIDVKQVVNTNKCVLHLEKHGNKAFIISAIDNLLKGASGQAVQNMNLMFGLDPKTGLKLKPVAF
jgi:N-acetyl-gamma-glutamyl-phosphate reductase